VQKHFYKCEVWVKKRKQAAKNGEWYFKASGADNGTKIAVIKANRDKYSISAMCRALNISRGMIYYTPKENQVNTDLESEVIAIHKKVEITMEPGKSKEN